MSFFASQTFTLLHVALSLIGILAASIREYDAACDHRRLGAIHVP